LDTLQHCKPLDSILKYKWLLMQQVSHCWPGCTRRNPPARWRTVPWFILTKKNTRTTARRQDAAAIAQPYTCIER
jgi:hypothetical protein